MQDTQLYRLQWLSDLEIPLANKFYRKQGFRGKAKRNELCAVVRNQQQIIIASAYIRQYCHVANEQAFKLLAGVAVAPEHQGRGVARLMLQQMSFHFDCQTYTFPYEHLVPFYLSLGFKLLDVNSAEKSSIHLTANSLYQTYRNQGRLISLMVFR